MQFPSFKFSYVRFEVRHPRCVEPKLLNDKSTVKTQLYLLAMSGVEVNVCNAIV
jgi:hypothetical protein